MVSIELPFRVYRKFVASDENPVDRSCLDIQFSSTGWTLAIVTCDQPDAPAAAEGQVSNITVQGGAFSDIDEIDIPEGATVVRLGTPDDMFVVVF
jgi:hypothetical protein